MTPTATMPISVKERASHVSVAFNRSGGYNDGESNTVTEFAYTIGTGKQWYKLGAKGFFYGGSYSINGTYKGLSGSQLYFGVGILGEANLGLPLGPVTLGLGGTFGTLTEFGSYTDLYKDDVSSLLPLGTGYWFLTVDTDEKSQFGLQLGGGIPGGAYLAGNFFHDQWGGTIGIGPGTGNDNGDPDFGRVTLGLSYKMQ